MTLMEKVLNMTLMGWLGRKTSTQTKPLLTQILFLWEILDKFWIPYLP